MYIGNSEPFELYNGVVFLVFLNKEINNTIKVKSSQVAFNKTRSQAVARIADRTASQQTSN